MVQLTINLSPPLTGAQSKLHLIVGDAVYLVIDLPPSVNGLISMGISVSSPELDYAVILPEQTLEGVAYREVMSQLFTLVSDVTLNIVLTPVTEPEPPTPTAESLLPTVASAIAGALAVIWGFSLG